MGAIEEGKPNPGFVGDDGIELHNLENRHYFDKKNGNAHSHYKICDDRKLPFALSSTIKAAEKQGRTLERPTWGNSMEFLFSCIAMSVGLGNVWRFPFTAYENGGGAFLIPYIIVLFVVGKPCYYLEMIIGQFTSRSSVKMWAVAPALRGVGWAQMFSMVAVGTYYCSLMSITVYYLFGSFQAQLPWSACLEEWGQACIDSGSYDNSNTTFVERRNFTGLKSSAELYFTRTVLKEKPNIDDGLGFPDWRLILCLLLSWLCIFGVLARGVQSSGKASYFLALFPYVIMIALLIRAVTLEGATTGILYFIRPNWSKLFLADVWYAAVTQCFFSLSVCFGGLITYSSYNDFRHNIYRDVIVVTSLDTLTSLMAGFTIFGILGNLAHELGTDDISNVVRGGSGLAFISYPDAIAKFTLFPQLFSVLFFLMLYVLGIGSGIALTGGIISIINDQFPNWKHWYIVLVTSIIGFSVGTIYCTPLHLGSWHPFGILGQMKKLSHPFTWHHQGGQFVLGLVDYYAASFVVFILASMEVTGVFWLYGLENFLDDVEFMLGRRPTIYWRICWTLVTPLLLIAIFVYTMVNRKPLTYEGIAYPDTAYAVGWTLLAFGILQVPFWYIYTIFTNRNLGLPAMFLSPLKPSNQWGPLHQANLIAWRHFKETRRVQREKRISSRLHQFLYVLVGYESKLY